MATQWDPGDVPGLLHMLRVYDTDLREGVQSSELRLMLIQYGLTPRARRSLRWTVDDEHAAAAVAADTHGRRRRTRPAGDDPRLRLIEGGAAEGEVDDDREAEDDDDD